MSTENENAGAVEPIVMAGMRDKIGSIIHNVLLFGPGTKNCDEIADMILELPTDLIDRRKGKRLSISEAIKFAEDAAEAMRS